MSNTKSLGTMSIGPRTVGHAHRPYLIAEAGVHHENSIHIAKEFILRARTAGVDAIKFQTYDADLLAASWAPTYWDSGDGVTQHDIFASRSRLTRDDYVELFAYADNVGIELLSTPFDLGALEMLVDLGMKAIKIASGDLTNTQLLRAAKDTGLPVVLSTGASTYDEIDTAVQIFDASQLAILHCSLSYPSPLDAANLNRIGELAARWPELIVGYSDHTRPQDSELVCPMAVGLGARIIEKHFTLNKFLPDDDHDHSVDGPGLDRLAKDCREAFTMTPAAMETTPFEGAARESARRSVVAAHALEAGHVLSLDDLEVKRPGTGLSPSMVDSLVGMTLCEPLQADQLLSLESVK